ncbi:MAG TPA: SpoIIE family protein phosphatase [Bacteroidales bacterium]|nr:SpoIIE family protein phosphatase [Bacteroidales bacterium]
MIAQDNKLFSEAKKYYEKSLDTWMSIDNKRGLTFVLNNLGSIYQVEGNLPEALKYGHRALDLARELGFPQDISLSARMLSEIYSQQKRWQEAFNMQQLYYTMNDSIRNESTRRTSMRKQFEYEYDKKESLLKSEQEKERIIAEEKARKQKIIIRSSISGLLMLLLFAVFIYRSLRITQRQKKTIEIKNVETEMQKKIIEEKNKDITDSINYAKRIQQAKLPVKHEISALLPESFILFKPKDIVSGDFYYFRQNNGNILLAAADCTGHGVPGAFMSLIGSEKLDEAILRSSDPSDILLHLNNGIRASLHQSDSEDSTRDGMDIALVSINNDKHALRFAGANRPLWIIRKGKNDIEEILPTKTAIGGYTEVDQQFISNDIILSKGDAFYIFSDGYADTYSGKEGKKLKTKKFKEILINISGKEMSWQEKYLDEFIEEWKGGIEQMDDILVIGVRV